MICSSKDNSIKFLLDNGATDDVRKIIDVAKFDAANEKLTKLAQVKYGLDTMGADLFSIGYESKRYLNEPYYRESTFTTPRAIPNEVLFNQLDILIDQYESRASMEDINPSEPSRITSLEDYTDFPVFEYDLSTLENARSKEIVAVLAERLSIGLKTNHQNITQTEARNLLKNSPIPYQGEPAFFFAGTVYTVGDNVSIGTVLHEFSHPLLQGIRQTNPRLFEGLYAQLKGTSEGQEIIRNVQKAYPELEFESGRFMEEALAYALQRRATDKVTKQLESEGFENFIKNLLNQIKQLLKNIFGNKVKVAKLNESTSLEELADMLLEKDFEFETERITNEDAAAFARFEIEMKEKKDRLDDALQSTKAALEEGILPGAGTALLSARIAILNKDNTDFGIGGKIVYDACATPFNQILKNAGEDIYKWLIELNEVDTNYVPNINEGIVVDVYDSGIIDPTKVVRCALENAASAAVTLLMTEAVIYEKQDNKKSKDNEVDMSQFGM